MISLKLKYQYVTGKDFQKNEHFNTTFSKGIITYHTTVVINVRAKNITFAFALHTSLFHLTLNFQCKAWIIIMLIKPG